MCTGISKSTRNGFLIKMKQKLTDNKPKKSRYMIVKEPTEK